MYAMGQEPIPDKTAQQIRLLFAERTTEEELADAFALASNQFWWVEDNAYDFEEGTLEYQEACRITDEWGELTDEYKEQIFEVLIREGISIPATKQIEVLAPFMQRHGYIDGNGWWIKET